jgi:hypothetical protein
MVRIVRGMFVAALLALGASQSVAAHNAGHVMLPSGACLEIGSFKPVFLGPDKATAIDLMPETGPDEIGTSFAAFQGDTPILPGPCPR